MLDIRAVNSYKVFVLAGYHDGNTAYHLAYRLPENEWEQRAVLKAVRFKMEKADKGHGRPDAVIAYCDNFMLNDFIVGGKIYPAILGVDLDKEKAKGTFIYGNEWMADVSLSDSFSNNVMVDKAEFRDRALEEMFWNKKLWVPAAPVTDKAVFKNNTFSLSVRNAAIEFDPDTKQMIIPVPSYGRT